MNALTKMKRNRTNGAWEICSMDFWKNKQSIGIYQTIGLRLPCNIPGRTRSSAETERFLLRERPATVMIAKNSLLSANSKPVWTVTPCFKLMLWDNNTYTQTRILQKQFVTLMLHTRVHPQIYRKMCSYWRVMGTSTMIDSSLTSSTHIKNVVTKSFSVHNHFL